MKPKGVKIITEESEKEVTFLMDVDPLFVSLVKHAANQQPFRVIKEETEKGGEGSGHPRHDGRIGEKGGSQPYEGSNDWMKHGGSLGSKDRIINIGAVPKGGEGMSMIIQSILLPRGVSLDSLVTQKGLEFLSDADPDHKKEFDRYVRFEQLPVEKFDKDSLTLTKIHESGAWIIGGKLVDGTVAEKALTIAVVQKQPMADNPMNAPVRTIPMEPIEVSFGDVFQQELQAFLSVVTGVMSQSGRGTGDRKSDVLRALDAFGSFLSMSLDSIGEKAVKMNLPSDKREEKSEGGGEDMFKDKEEFLVAVKEAFGSFMQEYETKKQAETEEEKKKLEEEGKSVIKEVPPVQVLPPEIPKLMESIAAIEKSVKELAEKTDKLGGQLVTDPTNGGDETVIETVPVKKSVFSGVFSRRVTQQQQ